MPSKNSNRQPQSGASKEEKEGFTQLPAKGDKKEAGQKTKSLAPLLHWSVENGEE